MSTTAVAVDFETTYSDTRDIKKLGSMGYLRHPDTDIYLVSLFGEGVEWVGHPKEAPWNLLEGREWVSHNRSFDRQVHAELKHRGMVLPSPTRWHCTADMSACLQVKRDLATASKVLLGVHLDKGVRNRMKNQTWESMSPEFRVEAIDYALDDAKACWCLWDRYNHEWPEHERLLSEHTSLMTDRGVRIDFDLVKKDLEWLQPALNLVLSKIPWLGEIDAKGKEVKVGSAPRLRKECEKLGIPAPDSTDVKDERFGDWAEEWATEAPFVAAIQQWRQITRLIGFAEGCQKRSIDGRLRYGLKYCGAPHTRRWSGDLGLSVHNMPKQPYTAAELGAALWAGCSGDEIVASLISNGIDPEGSCNPRNYLVPPEGKVFVSSDLSQIEPRVLALLSGQDRLLALLRQGFEVYESQARDMGLYSDPTPLKTTNPDLRQTVKILNLGLGYGLGPSGLIRSYRRTTGKKLPPLKAEELVELYRSKNTPVTKMWSRLSTAVRFAPSTDKQVTFELPSGRSIRYYDVRKDMEAGCVGYVERGGAIKKLWHGLLTENCLAEGTLVLTDSGYKPIETVTPEDRVWDGEIWVSHEGVVTKGNAPTLDCYGVFCTPDHLILTDEGWRPAEYMHLYSATSPSIPAIGEWFPERPLYTDRDRVQWVRVYDIKNAGPRNRFTVLGDKPLIVHNCTQATARDALGDMILRLEGDMPVVLHVHDEILTEVPENEAETYLERVEEVMSTSPAWAPELPVACEAKIMTRYEKK